MSEEPLRCARCGKALAPGEAKMGQPLITAGELLRLAVKAPAALGGPPLPDVPYCADCRPLIARQRTNEQLKILVGMLAVLALVAVLIMVVL
ncbi:MAG TPA: hypothetical protein VD886_02915 [Herpetosiphonaceae bacterium]|nr:hypothetical protein [Herpetosiphonaceae bacterium]